MSDTLGPLIRPGIKGRPVWAFWMSSYCMKHSLSHLSWTTFSETVFVKISTLNGLHFLNMLKLKEFLAESLIFCAQVRPNITDIVTTRKFMIKNEMISGVEAWKRAFRWDMIVSKDQRLTTDQSRLARNREIIQILGRTMVTKIWKSVTKSDRSGNSNCEPRCNRINILVIRI